MGDFVHKMFEGYIDLDFFNFFFSFYFFQRGLEEKTAFFGMSTCLLCVSICMHVLSACVYVCKRISTCYVDLAEFL